MVHYHNNQIPGEPICGSDEPLLIDWHLTSDCQECLSIRESSLKKRSKLRKIEWDRDLLTLSLQKGDLDEDDTKSALQRLSEIKEEIKQFEPATPAEAIMMGEIAYMEVGA